MMYISISGDWLFSRRARRVYFVCALLNLALVGTRIAITAAMATAGVWVLSPHARLMIMILSVPEVVGTAVLFVGMSYCWLGFGGSYKKKLLWFVFLRLFFITTPIYYFTVYRTLASRKLDGTQTPALAD